MNDLAFASIRTLKDALEKGDLSVSELAVFSTETICKHDAILCSALEVFEDVDLELPQGSLYGIPGIIKDNICQKGRIASCASKILKNYIAPYDATVVTRLRAAGAYSLGRANLDEFAMGSSTETSAFKKTAILGILIEFLVVQVVVLLLRLPLVLFPGHLDRKRVVQFVYLPRL